MKVFIYLVFIITTFISPESLSAQVGGKGVYSFLNLHSSPRLTALGGQPIAINDGDANIAWHLPAFLGNATNNQLALNYVNYFSDINFGHFVFTKKISENRGWGAGIQYLNYGTFQRTDDGGNEQGIFTAGDYLINFGYGFSKSKWSYGVNFKAIYSYYESYSSLGLASDLNISYTSDSGLLAMSFLAKNLGMQVLAFESRREQLAPQVQWSFSKKLKHAPLRLIAVIHHLNIWDLTYLNTNDRNRTVSFDNPDAVRQPGFFDKAFRHVILASELVINPNMMIRFGYNHKIRQEMTWGDGGGFTGFAWGVGIKVKKVRFDFANAAFFPSQATNQFSITLNLNDFVKK